MSHAEVAIVQTVRHLERSVRRHHLTARSLPREQLVRTLRRPAVQTRHHRYQILPTEARLHRDHHHRRRTAATVLLRRDLVRRRSHFGARRPRYLTRVHVDRYARRQRRRHAEVVVVVRVRIHLAHLDVLVYDQRRRVRQLRNARRNRVRRQVQRAELPVTGRRVSRSEVLEPILVVRLAVLQPQLLVLAHQRPGHARHVLYQRPLLQIRVATQHRELTHLLRALRVVQVHCHRRQPLATVVRKRYRPVVRVACRIVHSVTIVLIRNQCRTTIHAFISNRVVEHARVRTNHQTHCAVEHRTRLRSHLRHHRDRDRV